MKSAKAPPKKPNTTNVPEKKPNIHAEKLLRILDEIKKLRQTNGQKELKNKNEQTKKTNNNPPEPIIRPNTTLLDMPTGQMYPSLGLGTEYKSDPKITNYGLPIKNPPRDNYYQQPQTNYGYNNQKFPSRPSNTSSMQKKKVPERKAQSLNKMRLESGSFKKNTSSQRIREEEAIIKRLYPSPKARKMEMVYDFFIENLRKTDYLFDMMKSDIIQKQLIESLFNNLMMISYNGVTGKMIVPHKLIVEVYQALNANVLKLQPKQMIDAFMPFKKGMFIKMVDFIASKAIKYIDDMMSQLTEKKLKTSMKEDELLRNVVFSAFLVNVCGHIENSIFGMMAPSAGDIYDGSKHEIVDKKSIPVVRKVYTPMLLEKIPNQNEPRVIRKSKVTLCK